MRTAITLARKHGEKKLAVISGPDVPVVKQIDSFKEKFCFKPEHKEYEYAELWLSDSGRSKKVKLITPQAAKEKADAKAAAVEQAKQSQAKAAPEKGEVQAETPNQETK